MFGFSNSDSILLVVVIDFLISWALGAFIDRDEQYLAPDYQEYVGCTCASPLLFVVNLVGVGILLLFSLFGILGPWWTWSIGIITPYLLVVLVLISSHFEEVKQKARRELLGE